MASRRRKNEFDDAKKANTAKTAEERILIRDASEGSGEAFSVLVERYRERCYWIAYGIVGGHEDALDIAQDAFVKVYRALDTFDSGKNFYTWLYRIVVNLSIDCLRRRGKTSSVPIDSIGDVGYYYTGESDADVSEKSRMISEVLAELPEKYRTLIVLRDIEGFSAQDVARIVSCSYTTVRWRLHRARTLFRNEWVKRFGEP